MRNWVVRALRTYFMCELFFTSTFMFAELLDLLVARSRIFGVSCLHLAMFRSANCNVASMSQLRWIGLTISIALLNAPLDRRR